MISKVDFELLEQIAGLHEIPAGAYNIRKNSEGAGRQSTENIVITTKEDHPGIDIHIKPGTKNESVHIPVIITEAGITETVYNDFYVGEDADVLIVAGCGIHNAGDEKSEHDGIHRFFIGKNAHVKYVEKHYGEGDGRGERVMNPTTILELEENAVCELEMVQIKGVDSTVRSTTANLARGAKIIVTERLMTHGNQMARSDMEVNLNGEGSSAQIVSRSVGRDQSEQIFNPRAVGNEACAAHVQCDSIIMDKARIRSIPEIAANHAQAQIVHEAAIGRINNDQLVKLMSFGMDEQEAEEVIIQGFLR
ncbi:MAG: SufD family Fe-S cluster assembly protein [Clostridiaceae bacterium]|nr:SufD family Fe-S cluster assembly protein [Clostridiaceae bacterium]MDD6274360.1 SufD family Fe-S cluster assembly protein [Clostridiaceae bacterium]